LRDKSFKEIECSISIFNGKHIHYFMKDFQAHRLISPCNCNPSPSPSPPSSPHPLRPLCTSLTSAVASAPQPATEAAPNLPPTASTPPLRFLHPWLEMEQRQPNSQLRRSRRPIQGSRRISTGIGARRLVGE